MPAKRNNGKPLERVIRLIHETLKDSPNTVINSNHKITNQEGSKREFDIFIESSLNGIPIQIVIECKSYKRPIPVDKIEAFSAKCDRIPSISKKIFVSESGYQADAIKAAERFGIILCDFSTISKEVILRQFPIDQLGLGYVIKNTQLVIDTTDEELALIPPARLKLLYHPKAGDKPEVVQLFVSGVLQEKNVANELWNANILKFMKSGGDSSAIGQITESTFTIEELQDCYVTTDDKKYRVAGIMSSIDSWLIKRELNVTAANTLKTKDQVAANRIAIQLGPYTTEVIISKDNFKIFSTDQNGNPEELKLLGVYDSKTGTLKAKGE